jgi:hypothetical protein
MHRPLIHVARVGALGPALSHKFAPVHQDLSGQLRSFPVPLELRKFRTGAHWTDSGHFHGTPRGASVRAGIPEGQCCGYVPRP